VIASIRANDSGWILGDVLVSPRIEANTTMAKAQTVEKLVFMFSPYDELNVGLPQHVVRAWLFCYE
jgi:hypothetical protein